MSCKSNDDNASSSSDDNDEGQQIPIETLVRELSEDLESLTSEIRERRRHIEEVLKQPEFQPQWENVRRHSIQFVDNMLQSNIVVSQLFSEAEPIVHNFQDDIACTRIKVSLMVTKLDRANGMKMAKEGNAVFNQLNILLKFIKGMAEWASEVQENWVTYHVTRAQMAMGENLEGADEPQCMLDIGRAIASWDYKMAGETRSMLNGLLYNYIALENILQEAEDILHGTRDPMFLQLYT